MRARALRVIGTAALLLIAAIASAAAQDPRSVPPDEDRFLNAPLPNIPLTDAAGTRTDLSGVANGRPLLFTFVFTRCAGVCSPFLRSWRAADRSISRQTGLQRLVISFDRRDSVEDMAALARHVGADGERTWRFAIAAPDDVRRLADASGFWYDWDPARQQFDHPPMLAAVRRGRLTRLLVGGTVTPARLDELVRDAAGEFVPSYPLPGRATFRCVEYDAATGRVALGWGSALLLVPIVVTGFATAIVFRAGARARLRYTAPR